MTCSTPWLDLKQSLPQLSINMTGAPIFANHGLATVPDQLMDPTQGMEQSHEELLQSLGSVLSGSPMLRQMVSQTPTPQQRTGPPRPHAGKRHRGQNGQRGPEADRAQDPRDLEQIIRLLTILILRQEATLQAMSLNTEIILFMQAGTGSCLPKLVETSAAWHRQLQNNTVDAPLRLRMASNFWSALSARVEMVQANLQTELAQGLRDKGVLNADGAWVFLAWDASSKSLRPTTQTPIPMSEMVQIIASIVELVKLPAMVNQFKALKALKSADLKSPTVVIPWTMAVSLRHERAQQLWQHLMRLVGSSVTQLLMCQMRPANLKRSKLSELIAKCVFGPK